MFDIPPHLIAAGSQYLDQLRALKFDPQALLWAREGEVHFDLAGPDPELGEWRLVLVTPVVDDIGPLKLTELLVSAYNSSALPREISPFVVEVISSGSPFFLRLVEALSQQFPAPIIYAYDADGNQHKQTAVSAGESQSLTSFGGFTFNQKWVYYINREKPRYSARIAQFNAFQKKVRQLAA